MADSEKSKPEQEENSGTEDDGVGILEGQAKVVVPMATATSPNAQLSPTVFNINEVSNQVIQKSATVKNIELTFNVEHAENFVLGEGGSIINTGDRKNLDLSKQSCLIEQTKAWVFDRRDRHRYVHTKAILVAKEKILKNKCLIIRGNSGDGKTRLAVELLYWLMTEHDLDIGQTGETGRFKKEPISLTNLMTWDNTISPNSHLAILFDDLFGYGSDVQREINWWKKRESFIIPCLQGAVNDRANCLIITVRNDIYYEHESLFDEQGLFTHDNVIDLSSPEFSLDDDKKSILKTYTATLENFQQFSEMEITEILRTSPGIGFPECCRVFASTPELQHKRVHFFKHPLKYMRDVIKGKFHEEQQKALLYLFLSHGNIPAKHLDLENENVDQITIEKVFNMSLSGRVQESLNGDLGTKLRCIRRGLESLCGSFVRKEKGVYMFFHDSIHDAVAILYGELTPQGFLRYCNSECLRYIVTPKCKETSCKIVVDEDSYEYVYQRILEELKLRNCTKFSTVASLLPWNDPEFLSGFFEWIDQQVGVPQDFCFQRKFENEANDDCESVFDHKTSEDEKNSFFVVVAKVNSYSLLQQLIERNLASVGQMKEALEQALSSGSGECASLLLDAGVKPDSQSCFSAVEGGKTELLRKLDHYGIIPTSRASVSRCGYRFEDVNVFHEACLFQNQEMVNFLLEKHPCLLLEDGRYSYSSLHFIARTGNLSLYQQVEPLVLESYSGPHQHYVESLLDGEGRTVLHVACASGSFELCDYLCVRYTSLVSKTDKFERHCLHFAAMSGNLDCFRYIAALTLEGKSQEDCQRFMVNLLDNRYWRTVLHWACESGSKELCLFVCQEYPALLSQRDRNQLHCLHFAAVTCDPVCFEALAKFVLQDMKVVDMKHPMDSLLTNDQRTVLHVACQSGNAELAMYLCKMYPSLLSLRDKNGRHCLHYTAEPGNLEFYRSIESLVLAGKTPIERQKFMEKVTSLYNGTVLLRACWFGSKDICMYLCEKYPSLLSIRDKFGMHCIHYVALSWNLDCYKAIEALVIREESAKGNYNYKENLLTVRGVSVIDLVSGEIEGYKKDLQDYLIGSVRPTSSCSSGSSPPLVRTRRISAPTNTSSHR